MLRLPISALPAILLVAALLTPADAQQRQVPASSAQLQLSYAPVVQRVAPAVVNVYASHVVENQNPFMDDPFFRQFFGGGGMPREMVQRSLGSGVLVDASGLDRHQLPRHRERQRRQGRARRQARIRSRHRAQGPAQRPRGAAHQGLERALPDAGIRQFRRAAGRRRGAGDRRSVRRRPDRDPRYRFGGGAHPGRHHRLSVLHPDRCRHQSGQFRRRAGRYERPPGRHQYGDLFALRRLAGHRLCHSRQHGAGRRRPRRRAAAAW